MSAKILYSQIGYDIGASKKAFVTGDIKDGSFAVTNAVTKQKVLEDKLTFWGEKWNENWFIADFSAVDCAGEYEIEVFAEGESLGKTQTLVHIGNQLLWNKTIYPCSLYQLDVRAANSYPEGGWRDCGSELQEISSHIIMLEAVCDLYADKRFPECDKARLLSHIRRAANYIALCQTENGGFMHEIHHNNSVDFENSANAVAVLARVSRVLGDDRYLEIAQKGYEFVNSYKPHIEKLEGNELEITHGADSLTYPITEFRTRELLAHLSTVISLYKSGVAELEDKAVSLTDEILSRRVSKENAECGLWGHLYTYPHSKITEKANYHCGAWDLPYKNYNHGAHKPYWIMPIIEMTELFGDNPNVSEWKDAVRDFAYGFFKPACQNSPFGILPAGVYGKDGLLYFSGWYHGHAKIYGYAAVLATKFYELWQDVDFLDIATANLQWVSGLNVAGKSLIVGVGDSFVRDWNSLCGTIVNGFDASPQFRLAPVSRETDLPKYLDDEGGIHHCAGFVAGLCAVNNVR